MGLTNLSASDLARMIGARDVVQSEVMAAHLARIGAVNPGVNAINPCAIRTI